MRELITQGLKFLEANPDDRLGAKCLVALAFLKDGASPDHSRIQDAVEACQQTTTQQIREDSVYGNGLAIVFLSELGPQQHRSLIERFASAMFARQKPNGGWGYDVYETGDTSQTQYAALSYWELLQVGLAPKVESVESGVNWLLRTQDPTGAWGYQGHEAVGAELVEQKKTSVSMLAAGLGSTMIFGNVLGLVGPNRSATEAGSATPSALKRVDAKGKPQMRALSGDGVDSTKLHEAIARGRQYFDANFNQRGIRNWPYPCYLLYSIERYKSFEELLTGDFSEEPDWYQVGYRYLKKEQQEYGGWRGRSDKHCATAFAVLFLLRSTQKSIRANLGEGTLVGGRGLSADLTRMKMRQGKLVTEAPPTEIDQLLKMLESSANQELDGLLNDPTAMHVVGAGPEAARRLQQILRSGPPKARVVAVRAISKLRDIDQAPALLYAMTDPDKQVVREADAGLRFISRRFHGFGLSDTFSDAERYRVLDQWKHWYRQVRPDAPPLP